VGNDCANQSFQVRQTDGLVLRRAAPPLPDNDDLAAVQAFFFVKKKLTINKTFLT
jgi:hypothetical protein